MTIVVIVCLFKTYNYIPFFTFEMLLIFLYLPRLMRNINNTFILRLAIMCILQKHPTRNSLLRINI